MANKKSIFFWIAFWLTAAVLLAAWFYYLQFRREGLTAFDGLIGMAPIEDRTKDKLTTLTSFVDYFSQKDGKVRTLLVLYQNNMEIRPGGGFIGAFGIVKIKNGEIISNDTHDTSNFDGRIPGTIAPPYPMGKTLNIKSWKLRDSNFSPDFKTNAVQAENFYHMGDGTENFDGIVGITTNVLTSFLEITGPVEIAGYPGVYGADNAILDLEYQVEKAYVDQGISVGERKSIMKDLSMAVLSKAMDLGVTEKFDLFKTILEDLDRKDIQVYLKDLSLQEKIEKVGWSGQTDRLWDQDYLMIVDANLGAYKSDYYVQRSFDYSLDMSKEYPEAVLKIHYNHTAKQKDWMTNDYQTYLRVYIPEKAWFKDWENLSEEPRFGNEFGKKYLGTLVWVTVGTEKTVTIRYELPKDFKDGNYDFKVQKQAGINDALLNIRITDESGMKDEYLVSLDRDVILSEM